MNSSIPLTRSNTLPQTVLAIRGLLHHGLLCAVAAVCLAFLPGSHAVTPAPDGGYPGQNTAEGDLALAHLDVSQGLSNTAIGYAALYANDTGSYNTAVGLYALYNNQSASDNTALGSQALVDNQTGSANVAVGQSALLSNYSGSQNTATGAEALRGDPLNLSTGAYNTATGFESLLSIDNGTYNVATGWQALYSNTTGFINTAAGASALRTNTTGFDNTATGGNALFYNTKGSYNTADGASALQKNTTGNYNTASGLNSLLNNTTGSNNVALGYKAGYNLQTGSNNIYIGASVLGTAGDASVTRIGNTTQKKTFIGGISGKTVASGVGVIINSSGQLGTTQSSARYKDDIKPMEKSSEAILALKPVTFRYKDELDPEHIPQFGLIAEEVEKVSPDLVVRDEDGKVSTVRYEAVNAMLLNEFLKEHRHNQEQQKAINDLKIAVANQQARNAAQEKQIEALIATVQLVKEHTRPAPRVVASNR